MASNAVLAAACNNQFSIDLYQTLIVGNQPHKNVFFSPFSITAALAMINVGAQGPTKEEISSGLHLNGQFGGKFDQINSAYKELYATLKIRNDNDVKNTSAKNTKSTIQESQHSTFQPDRLPQLNLANRVFLQDGMNIKKPFADTLQSSYNSAIGKVDFAKNANTAKNTINKWVENVTNNKIQNLFDIMSSDARLVLVSAIYFRARWSNKFPKGSTVEKDFFTADGRSVKSKFMHYFSTEEFSYAEFPDLKATAISLPYLDSSLQVLVVLPDEKNGLAELEKKLTVSVFDTAKYTEDYWVELLLPKFKVEGDYQLKKNLKSLGIERAFSNAADFSGITNSTNLNLSEVVHKSYIDVNEEGTEAAAATGGVLRAASVHEVPESRKKKFNANHPFLFAIVDQETKLVLFMGRVENPMQS